MWPNPPAVCSESTLSSFAERVGALIAWETTKPAESARINGNRLIMFLPPNLIAARIRSFALVFLLRSRRRLGTRAIALVDVIDHERLELGGDRRAAQGG